jgi:hypothetical protein
MRAEIDIHPDMDGKCRSRSPDAIIAALADAQHGRVARRQLLAAGLGRGAIEHRIEHGRLHRVAQGVYAVGHRVGTREARLMEALLASGPEAALSHRAAAALWGLRRSELREVTVPRDRRSAAGVVVHRCRLPPDEVTVRDGMAVTTVPRTVFDLAAVRRERDVRRALREAERQRLVDALSLADLVERHPGRRGVATIRSILADARLGLDVTRSELEERFLDFVAASGLPRPATNIVVLGYECDVVWREHGVIVELDGHASHGTREGFEADRERDRILAVAGWHVIRVTWRQLATDAAAVRADLQRLLSRSRPTFSMT